MQTMCNIPSLLYCTVHTQSDNSNVIITQLWPRAKNKRKKQKKISEMAPLRNKEKRRRNKGHPGVVLWCNLMVIRLLPLVDVGFAPTVEVEASRGVRMCHAT